VRVTSYFFVLLYCIALHCITAQPPPQTENSSVSQILSSVAFLVLFGLPSRILDLNRILCAVCSWRFCFSVFFNIFFVSGYVYFIKPTILSFLFQPTLNSCIVVYRRWQHISPRRIYAEFMQLVGYCSTTGNFVCVFVRFSNSGQFLGNKYGPGTGPIWLDDVNCTGSETNINNCRHAGWGLHNCRHREDVSIRCWNTTGKSATIHFSASENTRT